MSPLLMNSTLRSYTHAHRPPYYHPEYPKRNPVIPPVMFLLHHHPEYTEYHPVTSPVASPQTYRAYVPHSSSPQRYPRVSDTQYYASPPQLYPTYATRSTSPMHRSRAEDAIHVPLATPRSTSPFIYALEYLTRK